MGGSDCKFERKGRVLMVVSFTLNRNVFSRLSFSLTN
jgi:uncharacterized protein YkuJ